MPIRKSIRDIQTSNTISDIISVESTKTPKVKKTIEKEEFIPEETVVFSNNFETETETKTENKIQILKKILINLFSYLSRTLKKIFKTLSQIKPFYLISLILIILGIIILLFIPSNNQKDPIEQAKKEAESVKKQFSKHMILPENEQIDIRKITNKMEDPFFKDAEIGDYLIIFYKNRIAYIYSINKDIIVNAGVVFIDPKTATTTNTTTNTR